ncbi:MAG: hypothetical protein LBI92_06835 [Azoarcus sp.]|jgi:hypothetical protein|nr:hypothetical protein [Azoarcus sp.]
MKHPVIEVIEVGLQGPPGPPGSGDVHTCWGGIAGDIAAQTDLTARINDLIAIALNNWGGGEPEPPASLYMPPSFDAADAEFGPAGYTPPMFFNTNAIFGET